ncbi:MAG: ATP-binding cassette domain-containing protein [Bacteroidia bacterium]|nr:ATP-binding cassette domain-containing protein [Bacteroidia bacterium]
MIRSSSLSFSYNEQNTFNFPDIQADAAHPLLILGGSGVGKTTFLHLLAGLLRPKSGKIIIGERNISSMSTRELDKFRGGHIGLVFQRSHFVSSLNVRDNLRLSQYLARERQNPDLIREILERLNLGNKLDQKTYRLSIGEQQRVAIARAVLNDPDVILADEPTSALDDANADEVISLLEEAAHAARAALVIVTHDQRLRDRISNRVELS